MKPMDMTKFAKKVQKTLKTGSIGFKDPTTWLSTGNYGLNYIVSGDFKKGIPLGKISILAGDTGAGKSYIASGNIIKSAQEQNVFVILIDTENALDEAWLEALGVNTSPDKLLKLNCGMINDVASIISEFMDDYRATQDDLPPEERQKYLFVIDSLGMLNTPAAVDQFNKGDMKGDMGHKAKQLKSLMTNCTNMFGQYDIGMVVTNHVYASQDQFNPDPVIVGGKGAEYASSIVIMMRKLKLKEDEDGNKTSEVHGIRSVCTCSKSRYNRPFQSLTVKIPYDTGMSKYSGLIELFEEKGLLTKDGNKLAYTDIDGNVDKWFRKQITNEILDKIMDEFSEKMKLLGKDANGRVAEVAPEDEPEVEIDQDVTEEY